MKGKLQALILDPYPMRSVIRYIFKKYKIGSFEQRLRIGVVDRAHYGYCIYNAAVLAKKLGYRQISVLEFGVAGGWACESGTLCPRNFKIACNRY